MKSDDRTPNESSDRAKLLEEIRRRAEEAELKRIEEEEQERKPPQRGAKPATPPSQQSAEPGKAPSQRAPSQKAPEQKPVEQPPATPAPSQKPPEAKPAVVPPSQIAPVPAPEKSPTQKAPTQKAPSGGAPTQKAPVQAPPTQKAPSQKAPDKRLEMPAPQMSEPDAKAPFPAPFPAPTAESVPASVKAAREQRVAIVRERLGVALDRGKIQKAEELLAQLTSLTDDQTELEQFRNRLQEARTRKEASKEKKSAPPSEPPKPKEPVQEDRAQREARKKRVLELLDSADNLYQNEKYDRGLEVVKEILDLDEANEEATRLRDAIQKAQDLALKIQQEETRRKADEAANFRPAPPEAPKPVLSDKDVWGASTAPTGDIGYELPPEEKGPVGPPKRPKIEQVVEHLSKVRVPVKPLVIGGAILVLAIVGYLVIDTWHNTVSPAKYSLLILPATPLASDTAFTWIADGITEDLIRDFSSVSELRVIGGATALGFRTTTMTAPQIARSVGANYFLQWSILRASDGIVVQPSFYDSSAARPIWVNRYTTSMRELPSVRLELVHRLAAAMNVTIGSDEEMAFKRYRIPAPAAYDDYLRARHMLRHREQFDLATVIQTLENSVKEDSAFADAQSALGWAHILAFDAATTVESQHLAQASVCVQRALELGARNSETFRVWGLVDAGRSQYDKAIERLEQAVNVSPTDATSERRLAMLYAIRNKLDGALRAAQRAVADDPGNVDSYTMLGLVYQLRNDYPSALRAYEQGLRYARDRSEYASGFYADALVYIQQPDRAADILNDRIARVRQNPVDYYKLGRIEQSAGKPKQEWGEVLQKAKALYQERVSADPRDAIALSGLALVHTRLGEFKDALAANTKAQQVAPNNIEVLYNTARMFALQRDKAQAFQYLTKAVNSRYSLAAILDMDFFNLHSESEFLTAITR